MFKLQLETGNDAFVTDPAVEIARILQAVADSLLAGRSGIDETRPLFDVNGNRVGWWAWEVDA